MRAPYQCSDRLGRKQVMGREWEGWYHWLTYGCAAIDYDVEFSVADLGAPRPLGSSLTTIVPFTSQHLFSSFFSVHYTALMPSTLHIHFFESWFIYCRSHPHLCVGVFTYIRIIFITFRTGRRLSRNTRLCSCFGAYTCFLFILVQISGAARTRGPQPLQFPMWRL